SESDGDGAPDSGGAPGSDGAPDSGGAPGSDGGSDSDGADGCGVAGEEAVAGDDGVPLTLSAGTGCLVPTVGAVLLRA
ncbi:MAG: hypothetical protein ACRDUA_04585, partial [Micromonosporaceae bacterium]